MADNSEKAPRWIAGVEPPREVRNLSMTALLEKECREQPARLAQLIDVYRNDLSIREQISSLARSILSERPILFVGMGASLCSSITGSCWLQIHGRSSFFVDAGEWLHYSRPVWNQAALSLLVTTSGESVELVQLCKLEIESPVALLCNNEKSACWSLVPARFPILAGPEYGNATKTYTNATAACIILAAEILKRDWHEDANRVLDCYEGTLNQIFELRDRLGAFCAGSATIELIGRGPSYGSALMGALCVREMAGFRASAHSGAGFRHGPFLDVDVSHLAIIFALGRTAELGIKLASDCNARGGKVILVSAEEQPSSDRLLSIRVRAVPEPWESVTSVLVPQALTLAMIEKSGPKLAPRFEYGTMIE
jgi:glucosamine--fructose-6-phosphate aminotransferase (isomerizing)